MKLNFLLVVGLISSAWLAAAPVRAQDVTKETVEGVTNFNRLETTVACAGATTPAVFRKIAWSNAHRLLGMPA